MTSVPWTVFLDRDGTINAKAPEGEYVRRPQDVRLLGGAGQAIRRLNFAGWRAVVVTNQRGIALGSMTGHDLDRVHARLHDLLAREGAHVDLILHCPHDRGTCDCRKPLPGLLVRAQVLEPAIDFRRSVLIGDAQSDIDAGRAAGVLSVALGPGLLGASHFAEDLDAAVVWALARA